MKIAAEDADAGQIEELVKIYEQTAARLRETILHPPGAQSMEINRARAASLLSQVEQQIAQLKRQAGVWTGEAITDSIKQGVIVAHEQAAAAGVQPARSNMKGAFDVVNHDAVKIIARDTMKDLSIGAEGMGRIARNVIVKTEALKVTPQEMNQILGGRAIIEGKPAQAIRELRTALEAVHGEKCAIPCKDGITREYDSGYYAKLIGVTKTRQAVVQSKHNQFEAMGLDLVKIIGRISVHFCTDYLGHVYSISGRSGKYPALDNLPNGGPPFHPQCSKSTAPFIEGLSKVTSKERTAAA